MLALRSRKLCVIALLYACIFHSTYSRTTDYCDSTIDMYKYSERLHFVGEIGDLDFGLVNMSKTLHCCASGFTSIQWLKDGIPYPWSATTSTFTADEITHRQTLISGKVKMSDSGVYTCIVKNESATLKQNIRLEVLAPESAVKPRMTYATKDQTGNIGDFARLYCEGFVGLDKKSNFSGTITWEKGLSEKSLNRGFIDGYRVIQINSRRDNNQILGSYLIFMSVEVDDLNMYTCRINNGHYRAVEQRAWIIDGRDPEELARMLFISVYAILPMFALASVLAFLTSLLLPIKMIADWLRKLNDSYYGLRQEKKHILVIYHSDDDDLMSKGILPKLLDVYPFRVSLCPVYDFEEDSNELMHAAQTYDGVMAILSTNLAGNEWTCERINLSIAIINKLHQSFMFVLTRKLPPLKGKSGQQLRKTLKSSEIHMIRRRHFTAKLLRAYLNRMYKFTREVCSPCGSKKEKVSESEE